MQINFIVTITAVRVTSLYSKNRFTLQIDLQVQLDTARICGLNYFDWANIINIFVLTGDHILIKNKLCNVDM